MHYSNMKKVVKIIIIIVVSIIIIGLSCTIIPRYIQYGKYIGTYEIVEGDSESPLVLGLHSWSIGKKENQKCNLWGCSGYSHGNMYYIKNGKIKYKYDKNRSYETNIEYAKDGKDTYLVFTDYTFGNVSGQTKWKKVK